MRDLDYFKDNPDARYHLRRITDIERRMYRKQDSAAWMHLTEVVRRTKGAAPTVLVIHAGGTALIHVPVVAVWEDDEAVAIVGPDGDETLPEDIVESVLGAAGPMPDGEGPAAS